MHHLIHGTFRLLFGDFNGVQVFLYPMTLFWCIDSNSFLYSVTGLLTTYRHFFPLSLFLLLFLYIVFLVIKNYSSIIGDEKPVSSAGKRSFNMMVIDLHKILLVALAIIGLVYILAAFFKYYYDIRIPLKMIYPYIFRGFSIFLILYYLLKNIWTKPFREAGLTMERAFIRTRREYREHPEPYAMHAIVVGLMVVLGAFVYNLLILNLIYPLISATGISPNLYLTPPSSIPALLYDIFILGVAFMISNLLFSPMVMLISHFIKPLHPHTQISRTLQRNAETNQQEE